MMALHNSKLYQFLWLDSIVALIGPPARGSNAGLSALHRIVLPAENKKDLHGLPDYVLATMEFVFVNTIREALIAIIPGLAAE